MLGVKSPLLGHDAMNVFCGGAGKAIATVPLNPPTLVRFMVEVAFEPERKDTVVGLAEKVKSRTLIVIWRL